MADRQKKITVSRIWYMCPVLEHVYGQTFCDFWYMTRYFTMTASGVVCVLPLCYPKRIDFLKYARYTKVS